MSQVPDNKPLPQWLEHRSLNFVLRFLTDSAAERDLGAIVSRLEVIRDTVVEALALRDMPDTQAHVYLSDVPNDEQFPDQRRGGWVSENGVGHIHAIYTSDAPAEDLERAVVEMILASSVGVRPPQGSDRSRDHVTKPRSTQNVALQRPLL